MRILVAAGLLALLCGCNQHQPSLSGGKPVDHWVSLLRDSPDPKVRKEAAFKLGNVGSTDPAVLSALCGAIKDGDAAVRCEVILALVKCGPVAQEAVPALTELREHDRNPKVRSYASKAVEKLRSKD